ncbi:MAG: UbiA family prenyltransferase [Promethearchaeota archaeon]
MLYTAIAAYFITVVELSQPFNWFDFVFLLISLFLAVSGATVLNMYFDRDIDAIMERTKGRPLPSGRVSASTVLINGIVLTFLGIFIAFLTLDWLTALVIFFGFFFDVVIYTIWLKRRTKFSIIFGGIAGGLPAMAGRIVVLVMAGKFPLDEVGMEFLLFILAWIPVHILTLALLPKNFNGYKEAKIPMWPVVSSEKQTMRVIALGAVVSSMTLYRMAHLLETSAIIRILIFVCDLIFLIYIIKNLIKPSNRLTFLIFKIASLYMILGFLVLYLGVVF